VTVQRTPARLTDPLGTVYVSLGTRMVAQMAACRGQPIRRMFPKYMRLPD
jgi:hypothetical protein